VALCNGDFKLYSDTSRITPCQLVIELHVLECMCLVPLVIFCNLKNEGSSGATHLSQILFQIGKNFTETFQMSQQAYGEDCLSRTPCYEWYQRFKSGRTYIKYDPKSGRPSTSMDDDRVEKVLAVIRQNIPHGETVNKEFYLNVLKRLRAAVRRKRPEAWTNNTRMLHHDNAPAHASLLICKFFTKHETTVVPQPSYSPDLAPVDFFLFPNLKSSLRGHRFQTVEETEENLMWDLRAIPQNTFQNWKKRLGAVHQEWRGVF